ncbi:5-amino-6-(5-phosphoribosylamino)uracil reductase [Abeliophyllum distichum]|uniref:5-amino-6-(5-phosphoribosylamino)uracil reductase n=1 Tax=Abeliophyllum distichum TaxID=126358 RepID=A0ABD1RVL4_9LAMI
MAIGETSFAMAYGAEVIIPVEVGMLSLRCLHFDKVANEDLCKANLNLQEERHADWQLCLQFIKGRWLGISTQKLGTGLSSSMTLFSKRSSWLIGEWKPEPLDPHGKDHTRSLKKIDLEPTDWKTQTEKRRSTPITLLTFIRTINRFYFCFS